VEDDIRELGVEFVFGEVLMDLLEIGQERVFLQFEVNISIGEPGLG
jgi:hypothetical protein